MIKLLQNNLFIGDISDLSQINNQEWAFIHATQTIHYQIFGWNRTTINQIKIIPTTFIMKKIIVFH